MRRLTVLAVLALIVIGAYLPSADVASAATDCSFTVDGLTLNLDSDCTTDETILIPDGFTLDGNGFTVTAVDPAAGHFVGAVVANAGATAHVVNLNVTASGLLNVCDGGTDRLRGIMFEGASGSITHSTVTGINQGPSGCQEGNAIEVRNAPFDNTHPGTTSVEISHNVIADYQKTGIVANGDVDVQIAHNTIGASATQVNLAANSVQLGYGATGVVALNHIDGNQWKGASDFAATAILLYASEDVLVEKNIIRGNSDIGIYEFGDSSQVINNKVFDIGADDENSGYDIGIGAWGSSPTVEKNKVAGFELPFGGTIGDKNVVPNR